jgi:hypothetical protein
MNQLMMAGAYFAPFLILIQMVGNQATTVSAPIVTVEKPAVVQEVPEEPLSTVVVESPKEGQQPKTQKERNKEIVRAYTVQYFGESEWPVIEKLVMKESGFNNNAQNKHSTAFGLFQFLDSTWQGTGIAKTSDPIQQTEAGMIYIRNRYGSPTKAMQFHRINNWY